VEETVVVDVWKLSLDWEDNISAPFCCWCPSFRRSG
jgi:hypothetical protein